MVIPGLIAARLCCRKVLAGRRGAAPGVQYAWYVGAVVLACVAGDVRELVVLLTGDQGRLASVDILEETQEIRGPKLGHFLAKLRCSTVLDDGLREDACCLIGNCALATL